MRRSTILRSVSLLRSGTRYVLRWQLSAPCSVCYSPKFLCCVLLPPLFSVLCTTASAVFCVVYYCLRCCLFFTFLQRVRFGSLDWSAHWSKSFEACWQCRFAVHTVGSADLVFTLLAVQICCSHCWLRRMSLHLSRRRFSFCNQRWTLGSFTITDSRNQMKSMRTQTG